MAGDPSGTERLHEYWVHGAGALKIRWGEPGDFGRCVRHLGKYIADPKGYCNLAHHAALGIYPATHAKELGRSVPVVYTEARATKAPYGDVPYGDPGYLDANGDQASKSGKPGVERYPLTADKVQAAWSYINQKKNAGQYTPAQLSAIKGRIRSAMSKHGHEVSDDSGNGRSAGKAPGGGWDQYEVERRFTAVATEIRAAAEGQKIAGYAAVFGQPSRNLGGFIEVVGTGAFNQARSLGWPNVVCRYNHDPNMVLGTTAGRTLSLQIDNTGLDYEVLPPQSRQDIRELVERGDVQHSSFAFRVPDGGDEWATTRDTNYPMRTLHEVQLVDVAPVLDPAYPDATAGLRSLARAMDAPLEEVRSMAAHDDLRRFFTRTDRSPYVPPKEPITGAAAMMKLMEKRFGPKVD